MQRTARRFDDPDAAAHYGGVWCPEQLGELVQPELWRIVRPRVTSVLESPLPVVERAATVVPTMSEGGDGAAGGLMRGIVTALLIELVAVVGVIALVQMIRG